MKKNKKNPRTPTLTKLGLSSFLKFPSKRKKKEDENQRERWIGFTDLSKSSEIAYQWVKAISIQFVIGVKNKKK